MIDTWQMIPHLNIPEQVFFGKGSSSILKKLDLNDSLLLISNSILNLDRFLKIQEYFSDKVNINIEIITHNEDKIIRGIAEKYISKNIKNVISIGGGKVMDSGKLITYLLKCEKASLNWDINRKFIKNEIAHIICPTTPSTGSEANTTSVIWQNGEKLPISHKLLLADLVILEPYLLQGFDKDQLLIFSADILSHALEGCLSKTSNELSRILAINCISLLEYVLPQIDKNNILAKDILTKLQLAGYLGGIVAGNAFVGIIHALAHSFENITKVNHSQSIIEMFRIATEWQNAKKENDIFARVLSIYSQYLNKFADNSLWSGIEKEHLITLTLSDVSIKTNYIRIKKEDIEEILSTKF